MRDDIHRHAPIGPKLKALLGRTFREADRALAKHLADRASAALRAEFFREVSEPVIQRLKKELQSPNLFPNFCDLPNSAPLEDMRRFLSSRPEDVEGALRFTLNRFIDATVVSARSGMIEKGGASPAEIRAGLECFRSLLREATSDVVRGLKGDEIPKKTSAKLTRDFVLPRGGRQNANI